MELSMVAVGSLTVAGVVVSCVTYCKLRNDIEQTYSSRKISSKGQNNSKKTSVSKRSNKANSDEDGFFVEGKVAHSVTTCTDADKTATTAEVNDTYNDDPETSELQSDSEMLVDATNAEPRNRVEGDSGSENNSYIDELQTNDNDIAGSDSPYDEDMTEDAVENSNDTDREHSDDTEHSNSDALDSDEDQISVTGDSDNESTVSEYRQQENDNIFSLNLCAESVGNSILRETVRKIRYKPLSIIGVGEGVKVYKGRFEGNVKVAVKKIPVDVIDMEKVADELTSLQRKLNKTVKINQEIMPTGNDNIVKYFGYEFEVVNPRVHLLLALERCDRNLFQYIQERSQLPVVQDKEIFMQLSSGLHFLHSRKIVHRDLKPSNVVLKIESNENIIFKLSDFGLSKTLSDSESGASVSGPCGTYGWMAPEVYTEENAEKQMIYSVRFMKKSDIFPLGQIFYFVASNGYLVYRNQESIQKNDPDYSYLPRGNKALLYLIQNMLAQNYENRPCARKIVNHPALWSTSKTLDFFHTASKLLEKEPNGCPIENNSSNVLRGDWQQHLTRAIERHLFPTVRGQPYKKSRLGPNYKRKSVQSLLRAIRNNKEHYLETTKSIDIKNEFGSYPDEYLRYWTSRYPELLMHTYAAMGLSYSTHYLLRDFCY